MPVSSRREGDSIMVDGVDLKRAARNLRAMAATAGWQPPKDLNQAMELMARAFGYPSLHAVTAESLHGRPAPSAPALDIDDSKEASLAPTPAEKARLIRAAFEMTDAGPLPGEVPSEAPRTANSEGSITAGLETYRGIQLPVARHGHMVRAREPGDARNVSSPSFVIQKLEPQSTDALLSNPSKAGRFHATYVNLRARFIPMISKCASGSEFIGIVGRARKGKSTFARAIAAELGAVVVNCVKDWPPGVTDGSALTSGIVFFDNAVTQFQVSRVAEFARTRPTTTCVVLAETADLLARFATGLNPEPDAQVQALDVESLEVTRVLASRLCDVTNSYLGWKVIESAPAPSSIPLPSRSRARRRP